MKKLIFVTLSILVTVAQAETMTRKQYELEVRYAKELQAQMQGSLQGGILCEEGRTAVLKSNAQGKYELTASLRENTQTTLASELKCKMQGLLANCNSADSNVNVTVLKEERLNSAGYIERNKIVNISVQSSEGQKEIRFLESNCRRI